MKKQKCARCGKPVKGWGIDACPVVNKGMEMGVLFGYYNMIVHYKCQDETFDGWYKQWMKDEFANLKKD